jgi:hypothetical protein
MTQQKTVQPSVETVQTDITFKRRGSSIYGQRGFKESGYQIKTTNPLDTRSMQSRGDTSFLDPRRL